jgi:hypothetical protein
VENLTVVCLNWRNYLGRGSEYVTKLRNAVDRNLTVPHEFVEVTESDIPAGREGWFNKLYLLEMFDGDVLFLDLDVIITANIDHLVDVLASDRSRIWARDDWSYPVTNPRIGKEATINSSVMLWHGRKDMTGAEALISSTHGDQGIITQLFWPHGIGLLPTQTVQSYKYQLRGTDAKPGPIVVCHGQPKPHELREPWVRESWS